jgi:hypothetical protein
LIAEIAKVEPRPGCEALLAMADVARLILASGEEEDYPYALETLRTERRRATACIPSGQ